MLMPQKRTARYMGLLLALLGNFAGQALAGYEGPAYGDEPHKAPDVVQYIFAVHPLHNPKRLYEVYQPLVDLINNAASDFQIRFEASRDYRTFEDKLYARKFHFALPNPYQTVVSEQHGYRIIGKMGDDQNFRGIIIARKGAGLEKVTDLEGAAISFPAPTALAATMMPKVFLYEHGLNFKTTEVRFVGSQESSIMNVFLGKTLAAGTWPPPWKLFVQRRPEQAKDLVVKWQTESLANNGLVARNDVPAKHRDAVAGIFLGLHKNEAGKKILAKMGLSRFEAATSRTFNVVRDFLEKYDAIFGTSP